MVWKRDISFTKSIPVAECLALTLQLLASGDSRKFLSFAFRIGTTAISDIIRETFIVLKEVLTNKFTKPPSCEIDWSEIARDFEEIWNLPKVVGALDRKHIHIEASVNSGILFRNNKGFFSIVLLVMCDAKYCFTVVNIGHFGSNTKGHVPGCPCNPLLYYLVGDEMFSHKSWLMKPFFGKLTEEQPVYNYRHSRPRHVIENLLLYSEPDSESLINQWKPM